MARYADDELHYLSGYVDVIEVNSSFYRIPSQSSVADWLRRTQDRNGFVFTAKLNREITHEFRRDSDLTRSFRHAFEPLVDAGRLSAVLAQFRYDFAYGPESWELLRWIHSELAATATLILELRHRSWQHPTVLGNLAAADVTVAHLDYPTAANSFDLHAGAPGQDAYLRLHGRNTEMWFARERAPHEPYNYDYTDPEIEQLAERARTIMSKTRQLTIVANNHYQGKAVSAAVRLKAALTQHRVPVPPALLETYPGLAPIAREPS
jgi:uncharacterized protein YecE (DUF72 family)